MCGRFDVDQSNREIDRLVAQLRASGREVKLGEIFPTNPALALALRDGAPAPEAMIWGFPRWDGKGVVFNARAESAMQKPLFKKSLAERPAVIPASGFYEWRENPQTRRKDRFRFTDPDAPLLYLAGFWNIFPEEDFARFTILTTQANPSMRAYHHRMPALVKAGEIEAWLNGENRAEVLAREPFAVHAEKS